MVDDGWTDTILEEDKDNQRTAQPDQPGSGPTGPENWDPEDWEREEDLEPPNDFRGGGGPPGGGPPNNWDLEDEYSEIIDNLDYFDAGDEVLESMVHAGYLENDRLDGIAEVRDAPLQKNSIAAIAERPDGRYNIFVDEEEFYSLFDENGVEEAVEAMRHELNHYRDFEDELLPDLRSDGEFSILLSYFAGNNLQGSEKSMEGANQFITEMESNEQTSQLNAYPEEVAAFQQHLKDYGPSVAQEIKSQIEENGYDFLFNYDEEREVTTVDVKDGFYREEGSINGRQYEVNLDLPEIGELTDHYDFEAEPEGFIKKPMKEKDLYENDSSHYDTENKDTEYSLRQVDVNKRDVTDTVIGREPGNMPAAVEMDYEEFAEGSDL